MPEPLFNSDPHLSPAKLAGITGVSADMQRDWRRRGYISNLGTQSENGRWLYDWYDAWVLYLMRQMYEGGCELSRAQSFATTVGQDVMLFAVEAQYPGKAFPQHRYYLFQQDPRGRPEDGGWLAVRCRTLSNLEAKPIRFLVDCVALANELPKAFDKPIRSMNNQIKSDLAKRGDADG